MRNLLFIIAIFGTFLSFGQQDTVFIKYNKDLNEDSIEYTTDTILFTSSMNRHILTGTTILPWTHNQQNARGFGLYFKNISKSDCKQMGDEVYFNEDRINSIYRTDSTLIVKISIYENCCYDFLCDISVDSTGLLNLIYHGYGTYCACDCCFGLTYEFIKTQLEDYGEINSVMINGNFSTLRTVE